MAFNILLPFEDCIFQWPLRKRNVHYILIGNSTPNSRFTRASYLSTLLISVTLQIITTSVLIQAIMYKFIKQPNTEFFVNS